MKRFANAFSFAILALFLMAGCLSNPFKSRQTTVFGTVTDNDTDLPVDSVEILIWGLRGSLKPIVKELQTVYTDKNGKYSATVDVPNELYSVTIDNVYNVSKYRGFLLFLNGRQTQDCCQADVGVKTQYDFRLIPK